MIDNYYSAQEVQKILKISQATLSRLQSRKELLPVKVGRVRRFAEKDIIAFLEKNKA